MDDGAGSHQVGVADAIGGGHAGTVGSEVVPQAVARGDHDGSAACVRRAVAVGAAEAELLARVDDVGASDAVERGDGRPRHSGSGADETEVFASLHDPVSAAVSGAAVAAQPLVDDGHDLRVPVAEQLAAGRVVAIVAADHCGGQRLRVADGGSLLRGRARGGGVRGASGLAASVAGPGAGVAVEPVDVDSRSDAGHVAGAGVLPRGGERPGRDAVGHGPRVPQGLAGVATRVAGDPQAVVAVGHARPVGHLDDAGAHVDHRLDAPCGLDALQPAQSPPAPRLVGAGRLPVQHGNHPVMHVAARLADEPVGLRLGTIAQVGAGEMVDAATDAVGLERLHGAVGYRIGVPVAFRDLHEPEVDAGRFGGRGLAAADAALPFADVRAAIRERDALREHQGHRRQNRGQHGRQSAARLRVAGLAPVEGRAELRTGWKMAALPCGSRAERLFSF